MPWAESYRSGIKTIEKRLPFIGFRGGGDEIDEPLRETVTQNHNPERMSGRCERKS